MRELAFLEGFIEETLPQYVPGAPLSGSAPRSGVQRIAPPVRTPLAEVDYVDPGDVLDDEDPAGANPTTVWPHRSVTSG